MSRFAFLMHPLDIEDVARKYKIAKKLNPRVVATLIKRRRPFIISEIEGVRSITGATANGWFVIVPLLPWQFLELEEEYVVKKILKAIKISQEAGAKLVGLGAFTALVGNSGQKLAQQAEIAVTTGNSYTVATAIEGTYLAAKKMEIDLNDATLAVLGGTGSIGASCVEIMAPRFKKVLIVGRDQNKLHQIKQRISSISPHAEATSNVEEALKDADVVVSVTGSSDTVVEPEYLKSGAVVCDVARPRDVSKRVAEERKDVLVIDGGIVQVPGNVNFNFNFGLPDKMALACMAETMILALEKRFEHYSIGKDIAVQKVIEMENLAKKHGFELAGLRSFERALSDEEIDLVKRNVRPNISSK